jgi:hypothetical protein
MAAPNFTLISELQTLTRYDFPVTDPTILNPLNSNPLVDGEWLELDSSYSLIRGTGEAAVPSHVVHTEQGRYDVQGLGKVNVLYLGMYEAETAVIDQTGPLALGDPLTVQTITFNAQNRRGLKKRAATSKMVVGFVTKIVSATKVRFVHYGCAWF